VVVARRATHRRLLGAVSGFRSQSVAAWIRPAPHSALRQSADAIHCVLALLLRRGVRSIGWQACKAGVFVVSVRVIRCNVDVAYDLFGHHGAAASHLRRAGGQRRWYVSTGLERKRSEKPRSARVLNG
jgi:hypothetical protein